MSDLVERARKSTGVEKFIGSDGLPGFRPHTKLINELADEIERLQAELARFVPMFSATKNNLYAGPPHSKARDDDRYRVIEDEDGAPYPQCSRCPDQIAPPDDSRPDWAHVYQNPETGNRWYLYNCQRPNEGRYGIAGNQATREETDHE